MCLFATACEVDTAQETVDVPQVASGEDGELVDAGGTAVPSPTLVAPPSSVGDGDKAVREKPDDYDSSDDDGGMPEMPSSREDSIFSADFSDPADMDTFNFHIYHRDDHLVDMTSWPGDHAKLDGDANLCGLPTLAGGENQPTRTIQRGDRSAGFNDDWRYLCVPDINNNGQSDDTMASHLMTSIGDTSGYSLGAIIPQGPGPNGTFSDFKEISWEVNQTDLGGRQWTEVAIIPAGQFNPNQIPSPISASGLPNYQDLGAVGTSWGGTSPFEGRGIHTSEDNYSQSSDGTYRCSNCPYRPGIRFGQDYGVNSSLAGWEGVDPARRSAVIRRKNFLRNNEDGTITWGFEVMTSDQVPADHDEIHNSVETEMNLFTVPGSFPDGPVVIVFADHNYTPDKGKSVTPRLGTDEVIHSYTWHWDNFRVS